MLGGNISIHLLLALLALVGPNEATFHIRRISAGKLMSKLQTKPLEPAEVYNYMTMVSHKKSVPIGATNLDELVKMNDIHTVTCVGTVFQERREACDGAATAHVENINNYCRDRLNKLARKCLANSGLLVQSCLFEEDPLTLEFLRSMMHGHFLDEPEKFNSIIEEFLGFDWRGGSGGEANTVQPNKDQLERANRMENHCKTLISDLDDMEAIFEYAKDHNDDKPVEMDVNAKGWTHTYELCKHFLATYDKQKFE